MRGFACGPSATRSARGRPERAKGRKSEKVKVSGGTYRCQGCGGSLAEARTRGRRGGAEKVTRGARRAASLGPIPFTSCSASSEPNGPCSSRSATIRAARAGPMPGSSSSSARLARSRSTGTSGSAWADGGSDAASAEGLEGVFAERVAGARWRPPALTAESTTAICRARASRSSADTAEPRVARQPRTASPSAATAAKKSSARPSEGVGTPKSGGGPTAHSYRSVASALKTRTTLALRSHCGRTDLAQTSHRPRSKLPQISRRSVSATSPTICSVRCETLSAVSSGV